MAGNHGLTVSWTASTDTGGSGILRYEVGLSTVAGGPYTFTPVGNVTSAFLEASNGVTWYAVVRAVDNASNTSANSAQSTLAIPFPWNWRHREPTTSNLTAMEAYTDSAAASRWVIAGDYGAFFTSTDNMVTWARRDALTDGRINSVYANGTTLYVVGQNGHVAHSDNDALTFTSHPVGTGVGALELTGITLASTGFLTSTFVAIATTGDVVRQVNSFVFGGLGTWNLVTPRPTTNPLRAVVRCVGAPSGDCSGTGTLVAVGDNGTIIRSTTTGTTWTAATVPAAYATFEFTDVVQSPNTNQLYASVSNAGALQSLLVSNDGGATWTAVGSGWVNYPVHSLDLTNNSATILAVSNTSMRRFPPNGSGTFGEYTLSGISGQQREIAGFTNEIVGTAGFIGSHTFTATLSTVNPTEQNSGLTTNLNAISMREGYSYEAWVVGSSGLVRFSGNSGDAWTTQASGTVTTLNSISIVATTNPASYGFAVGGAGTITRKSTAGVWALHADTGITTNTLVDVACRSVTNAVNCLAVGAGGTVLTFASTNVTLNDGNWTTTLVGGPNTYNAVDTYVAGATVRGAVVGAGGAFRSLTGTTWTAEAIMTGAPAMNGLSHSFALNGQMMACGDAGAVQFSTNHGVSWTAHNPAGYGAFNFRDCIHQSGTNDWFVSASNGVMLKGTWSGTAFTWVQLTQQTSNALNGLATVSTYSTRIYAAGNIGTVLRTDTSGN